MAAAGPLCDNAQALTGRMLCGEETGSCRWWYLLIKPSGADFESHLVCRGVLDTGSLYLLLQMCHDCFQLSNFPSRLALESEPTRSQRKVCSLSICSWVFLWGIIQRNRLAPEARGLHHLLSHQQVQDLVETVTGLCIACTLVGSSPHLP